MSKDGDPVEHGQAAAITIAGSLIAVLIAFIQTASLEPLPSAFPFDESYQVGQVAGIAAAAALVPWFAAYFLVIRDCGKAEKWMSLSAMVVASIFGLLSGMVI